MATATGATLVVGIRFRGLADVQAALDRLSDQVASSNLEVAGMAGAMVVERTWKSLFRGKSEQSVPGVPPRAQTGQYRQSIHTEVLEVTRSHAYLAVGSSIVNPPYPLYLEFGTARMAARPIARPAIEQSGAEALAAITSTLKALLGL